MSTDPAARTRHETIELTRRLDAAPADVFRAISDTELRRRWVRMPGKPISTEHDFRVGGGERLEADLPHLRGAIALRLNGLQQALTY